MKIDIEALEKRFQFIDGQFNTVVARKKEVYQYLNPNRAAIFQDPASQGKKPDMNFDGYPSKALNIFVNGLTSMIASPNLDFIRFDAYKGNGEKLSREERLWMKEAEKATSYFLGQSDFYEQNSVATKDGAMAGSGFLSAEVQDSNTVPVRFCAKHPATVRIIVDQYGDITTLYRTFYVSGYEAMEMFPKMKSDAMAFCKAKMDKLMAVRHCVTRTMEYNLFGKEWASYYYFPQKKESGFITTGGFSRLPFFAWLLDAAPNESWGYGIGEQALGEIKSMNKIAEADMKITQLTAQPPMSVPKEMMGMVDLTPDAQNPYEEPDRIIKPTRAFTDPRFITEFHERRKRVLDQWFYVDFFQMLTTIERTMTAFEVSQRMNEKATNIGPLTTSYTRYIRKPIEFLLGTLIDKKLVAPVPAGLAGKELLVQFDSPLIKVQKGLYAETDLAKLVQLASQVASFDPTATKRVAWGDALIETMYNYNLNPKFEVDKEVVEKEQEAAAQMQQAQQMAEIIKQGSAGAKNLGAGMQGLPM